MVKKYSRKPYRIKKKKSVLKNRFFWFFFLALFFIVGIFYFIFFTSTFKIKEIQISGNQKIAANDIQNIAKETLDAEGDIIFMISSRKIENDILYRFPQIEMADAQLKFPNKIKIEIKERQPVAVFFREDKYFLMDKNGIIFEEVSEINPEMLKIQNAVFNSEVKLGEKVIEKELIGTVEKINSKFKDNLKITIDYFAIPTAGRINVKTVEGWEVYFDTEGDLDWQMIELGLVLEKEIPLEKRGNLEYIDLRFSKIYYKYREIPVETFEE